MLTPLQINCHAFKTSQRHQVVLFMLVQALDEDQEGDILEYGKIFEEDREFNQGEFAECLRDQWLQVSWHRLRAVCLVWLSG